VAEAEDVLADAARHATIYARALWDRNRKRTSPASEFRLGDVAARLDLLIAAAFARSLPIRTANPPAPATFLGKVFLRHEGPRVSQAVPSTDGSHIWLPACSTEAAPLQQFRVLALQQAMRARRRSAAYQGALATELEKGIFLVFEADSADCELIWMLPGMRQPLVAARRAALLARPALAAFPPSRQALERFVRETLANEHFDDAPASAEASVQRARDLAARLQVDDAAVASGSLLFKDLWTGDLRPPVRDELMDRSDRQPAAGAATDTPRSARMSRPPEVREAAEDEDDKKPGAWMVQTAKPHEQVEDPVGMQRPTDQDAATASEEMADALSELPEARLVRAPGRPKDVFLSEDAVSTRTRSADTAPTQGAETALRYPEWDYRSQSYRDGAVTVHVAPCAEGPQEWVDRTLHEYRSIAALVRRRFEMLSSQRMRLRKQLEGDEVDVDAYIDACADFRAGLTMPQALYQTCRQARRDMASLLLVDVSGSTDGWIAAQKRVIDVEREALLLVSIALQGMREPYSVVSFSGEGPHGVQLRLVKSFEEEFGPAVARRIARLEPQHYTRAGAAIRHATSMLMGQPARHRLLMLLSDGKPNDIDAYEGRYGVEDTRQAVTEARLQGINSFCLTVDRQAPNYLPGVFGTGQYALLPRPEMLPTVLLEWMKRLVQS
jgi:nitric oxide reductase NorD protein